MKSFKGKLIFSILISFLCVFLGIFIGSVQIPISDFWMVFNHKIFSVPLSEGTSDNLMIILWDIRLPRVFSAFLIGGALSISGATMQSLLQNPLASSYTLGVSSGASFGILLSLILFSSSFSYFLPPLFGFFGAILTVFIILLISTKLDLSLQNGTIILLGMIFSLFINAISTLFSFIKRETLEQLLFWQMGSLSSSSWNQVIFLLFSVSIFYFFIYKNHLELDILSFGDEQASLLGISVSSKKKILFLLASALTGICVAFSGIIGFIDFIVPHIVRNFISPSHRYVLPLSFLLGGSFLVIADLISRTVLSPVELPVGTITAFIGAPFFLLTWLRTRKEGGIF